MDQKQLVIAALQQFCDDQGVSISRAHGGFIVHPDYKPGEARRLWEWYGRLISATNVLEEN